MLGLHLVTDKHRDSIQSRVLQNEEFIDVIAEEASIKAKKTLLLLNKRTSKDKNYSKFLT